MRGLAVRVEVTTAWGTTAPLRFPFAVITGSCAGTGSLRRRTRSVGRHGSCCAPRAGRERAVSRSPLLSGRPSWHRAAVEWFSELFSPGECATVILRQRPGPGGRQLSRLVGYWCHPSGQRLLRVANEAGSDVFCGVNPTVRGSSRAVSEVRRLQVDFDTDGDGRVGRLMRDVRSGRVPMPAVVWCGRRSAGGRSCGMSIPRRGRWRGPRRPTGGSPRRTRGTRRSWTLRASCVCPASPTASRAAAACVSCGFPAPCTTRRAWVRSGGSPAPSVEWCPRAPPRWRSRCRRRRRLVRPRGYIGGRRQPASQSEADWHGVVDALRSGESPGLLIQQLAELREDKANPRDYAERTVVRACRSLGVREPDTEYGRCHPARLVSPGR